MNQREVISNFIKENRPKFNEYFFQRDDDEIIQELMNVIYSCERSNEYFTIKVDSYRVVDDYDEINDILFHYYDDMTKNKSKSKKRDNQYEHINLSESYIRLLIVKYYIKDRTEDDYLDVIIAVPRIVDKFYFVINGITRSTLFQIVDGSTYNNGTSNAKTPAITLKITFMAARVKRYINRYTTTAGDQLDMTYYQSIIFNKSLAAAKYIFAKYGYYGAMSFLGLDNIIYITNKDPEDPSVYTFKRAWNFYINCDKNIVDSNPYVQAIITALYNGIIPGIPYEAIYDNLYWVRNLGAEFSGNVEEKILSVYAPEDGEEAQDTLEKGYSILDSFESIYDISTRDSIRLPLEDKETSYHVIRWIMREFNKLRIKDNLDIRCKKIRFATHIASLYAFKIAKGIYRVSDMNKKASIISIRKAIKTDPHYLLTAIARSGLAPYSNETSDKDSMLALKFTYKGVSGLGENSSQSIPDIYRSIHPSHIGRVDLDSSSDGNPGITGTICPYAPVYDGFFDEYQEPNTWEEEFLETMNDYNKARNLIDAFKMEETILGTDRTEEINVASEVVACMQQIIKPVMDADEGEYISLKEAELWQQQNISYIQQNNSNSEEK